MRFWKDILLDVEWMQLAAQKKGEWILSFGSFYKEVKDWMKLQRVYMMMGPYGKYSYSPFSSKK